MLLVDAFLEKHYNESGNADLPDALDYATIYLSEGSEEKESADSQLPISETEERIVSRTEALLDSFLKSDVNMREALTKAAESGDMVGTESGETEVAQLEEKNYTETLARVYLRQRRYDKALEIIRSIYLNFPDKNIYFADQIRFLELLIRINQNKK